MMQELIMRFAFGIVLVLYTIYLPLMLQPEPSPPIAIQRAIAYLRGEYNSDVGLLRESPVTAPHRYWLATDNRLAVYALERAGEHDLAASLSATLQRYGDPQHGLIEVLQGEIVAWPPYTETQRLVDRIGQEEVWLETRLDGNRFCDWLEYADLAMFGALNAFHAGQRAKAHQRYQIAMVYFDGVGFADKAYEATGFYATYKLALALYTAQVIGEPMEPIILQALLAKQVAPSDGLYAGGFYTFYDAKGVPQGDTNTETTAYAILALSQLSLGIRWGERLEAK